MRDSLRVTLEGRGAVTLRTIDHIATGGEGSIYRVGKDTVVKVYTDASKMKKLGVPDKIRQLALIRHPYIVSPEGLVLMDGQPVGLYMKHVEGHPLTRVFTNDFCKREGFSSVNATTLVDRMRETVLYAHSKDALIVDGNELNWFMLHGAKGYEPRIVDVDSWAIGRWPATAVMPSVRDWSASQFSEETDWFSWGIVTFQVFTGIHPYKGTLDGFRKNDFVERMKKNASVFSAGVRLNHAVRDFSLIPTSLLQWYEAVFQNGERSIPPLSSQAGGGTSRAARVMRAVIKDNGSKLLYEKLFERTGDPVLQIYHCGVAMLASGALIDLRTKREIGRSSSKNPHVVRVDAGWLIAELSDNKASFSFIRERDLAKERSAIEVSAEHLVSSENRLFVVNENGLTEIRMHNFGGKVLVSAGQTWSVFVNSATWFDSVGIEDVMGAKFVVLPMQGQGVTHIRVKELDGLALVDGKALGRFAALVGMDKMGRYHRVELTFSSSHASYSANSEEIDQPDLNLAILSRGVCAAILEEGELSIFVPSNGSSVKVSDKSLSTDMDLSNWEDKVVYIHDGAAWSLRMS